MVQGTYSSTLLRDLCENLVLVREIIWDTGVLRMSYHRASIDRHVGYKEEWHTGLPLRILLRLLLPLLPSFRDLVLDLFTLVRGPPPARFCSQSVNVHSRFRATHSFVYAA